ncbi:cell adhesion molecule 3-like [Anneissia japonica]|uniref:cell adhesion molecule 3-like n=1 Tax=Anneissia japonica TaxID=1529436 RepID=UPI0014259E7F|nr:cell adhesion molecule 3-like [Anneissia japonica]
MEYSWLKDGAPFIPDYNDQEKVDISKGNLVLDISDVQLSDEGQYQCVVKHGTHVIAMSRQGNLTVRAIPHKKYPQCILSKHLYTEGDKVMMSCISESKGNFHMKWFDPPQGTELRRKTDFTTLFASFEATKQQHGKQYRCLMEMEGEQVPRMCSTEALNITNQLHVYTTATAPTFTYAGEISYTGDSLNITCNIEEDFEMVSYKWTFKNCSSDMTNKFKIIYEKIYINTIAIDMNGCHVTCKAYKNNATGNYTYIMKVIKNDMPIPVYSPYSQVSTDHSQTIVVSAFGCCFVIVATVLLTIYKKKHIGILHISSQKNVITSRKTNQLGEKSEIHEGEIV